MESHNVSIPTSATLVQKRTSRVWLHIVENPDKTFKCTHCTKSFAKTASTTNFWRHLKTFHTDVIETEDVQSSDRIIQSFKQEIATKRLIKWIVCDIQPFSCVERPEFRDFVESINPVYRVPSRSYIKKLVMAELEKSKQAIRAILRDLPGSTSFTSDI